MARSADPFAPPAIRPNYLSAASDVQVLFSGTGHARRIFAAPPFARHSAAETMPGPDASSEETLTDFMHRAGMNLHHPVGACQIGEDTTAVVDSRSASPRCGRAARIDASVMPTVTTGNTNAPSIMIREKGAAMIREDAAELWQGNGEPRHHLFGQQHEGLVAERRAQQVVEADLLAQPQISSSTVFGCAVQDHLVEIALHRSTPRRRGSVTPTGPCCAPK